MNSKEEMDTLIKFALIYLELLSFRPSPFKLTIDLASENRDDIKFTQKFDINKETFRYVLFKEKGN